MKEKLLDDLPESFDGWLWQEHKLIPRNELTAIVGFDGVGKSTFALKLGAALTRGELSGKPEKVFFAMQEDALSITRARLHANGADTFLCTFQPDDPAGKFADAWTFPDDLDRFEEYIAWTGATVALIDSVDFHVDSVTGQKARQTLGRLREVCERRNLTILLVHHFNKTGTDIDKAIGGGRGVKAAMRCILVWGEKAGSYHGMPMPQAPVDDEEDPQAAEQRAQVEAAIEDFEDATHVLAVHKNSYGYKYPQKLSMLWQAVERPHPFDANETIIQFDHITDWLISPQQVFRPQGMYGQGAGNAGGTQRGGAKDLVLQILALADNWVPADELNSVLQKAGFSGGTVRDARRELKDEGLIENKKEGTAGWQWRIKPLDIPTQ